MVARVGDKAARARRCEVGETEMISVPSNSGNEHCPNAELRSREELAAVGITGVNPDLAARLLAYGYARPPAA